MKVAQNLFANYRVINNSTYIILDNEAFQLGTIEKMIWEKIGTGNSIENIISQIQKSFDDQNEAVIEKDVKEFIDELIESNLVEKI